MTSNVLLLQEWDIENLLHVINTNVLTCHTSLSDFGNEIADPEADLVQVVPRLTKILLNKNYNKVVRYLLHIFQRMQTTNSSLFNELTAEILQGLRDFEVMIPR